MANKVKCTCGHSWDKSDSSKKDATVCHICGKDNTMKNGGWLDKFDVPEAENGIEGTMGGLTDQGFNYNGAWGGTMQMGGSMPGAVGFTYARTAGTAPANGPYAKKTKASAQNGAEMSFYQNGLDWKPRNISRDGAWLDKYDAPQAQDGTSVKKPRTDMLTMDEAKKQEEATRFFNAIENQPVVQPALKTGKLSEEEIKRRNKAYAQQTGKKFNENTGAVSPRFSPQQAKTLKKVEENIVMPMLELEGVMAGAPLLASGMRQGLTGAGKYLTEKTALKNLEAVGNVFGNKKPPEIPDWARREMEFLELPELNNPEATQVLEGFKTRIATPEGQRRLKELGITETGRFDKVKIVEDPSTLGHYWLNRIGLNPELPEVKRVTRHEIEHLVQDAYRQSKVKEAAKFKWSDLSMGPSAKYNRRMKALEDVTTNIDKSLTNLELRKTPKEVDWAALKETTGERHPSRLYEYLSDKQRATDYFASGSGGKEKSAFLAEVQQHMMDKRIIPKKSYAKVTPEMVKETFIDAMFDEKSGGKYLRLFNIMKPTESNYKLISDNLNKMLGVVPAIGMGAAAAATVDIKKKGGDIKKDDNGYWNPENWGEPVEIGSNEITMEGVYQPLLGISDTGDVQMMYPGEDYEFDGESVTEYPMAKSGMSVNNADAQPIEKLDQLLNFTNYNKPTKGGWLDKYQ